MRLKMTPVAIATSIALLAPFATQAQDAKSESKFYGSVRIGLEHSDPGNDADAQTTVKNWASRMGFQGSTDMGNGLTGFGKYEWSVDTASNANGNGALGTRKAYVGVEGGFGKILLGQDYHTWYNNVIGPVDIPWWGSCNGCVSYTGRTGQAITYSNSVGAVSGGATVYMADGGEDSLDGFEIGATFAAGPVNVGVGMQDLSDPDADPEPTIGVVVHGDAGPVSYALNVTSQKAIDDNAEDATGVDLYASFGSAYIDIGQIDQGDNTPFGITLGYTHSVGPQTTMWFEVQSTDPDVKGVDSATTLRAALKYDW